MRVAMACVLAIWAVAVPDLVVERAAPQSRTLYDADPNHIWNRLHRLFHVRVGPDGQEYGFDTVDPLLWRETRYLLTGPSHEQAVRLLDEFLDSHAERLIADPVKRAVFQHDCWAVFDWLAEPYGIHPDGRKALMPRLARLLRRVTLTRDQIDRLLDTYRAAVQSQVFAERDDPAQRRAFLPRDLFGPALPAKSGPGLTKVEGPWVSIGGSQPIVPHHAAELSRSGFVVLWNLPGGAAETTAYLAKLWDFPQPYVFDPHSSGDGERRVQLNPALPALPDGTQIALVRQMLVIDDEGRIVPSKLTESIQLRVFRGKQSFFEFQMTRPALFAANAGGLRAVGPDDVEFLTFSSKGGDPFEFEGPPRPVRPMRALEMCPWCHFEHEPGIRSVRSVNQLLRPNNTVDSRHERWARWFTQPAVAAESKARRYEWGVLQGLWQANPR